MEKIRIILVEDHQLVREAWKASLSNDNKCTIVAEAENVKDAVHLIKMIKHDVIILDINLKNESGLDVLHQVMPFLAKPKIIVVSMMSEYSFVKNVMNLGVKGYVTKNSSISELIKAIESVNNGESYLCQEINELLIAKSLMQTTVQSLTTKEIAVLKEVCTGRLTKDIAAEIGVSVKTIEGHKTKIYRKLNTTNIISLVNYAKQNGIIN